MTPFRGWHPNEEQNCGWIYKEQWTNEVGQVKKGAWWHSPGGGWHPSEINKSDSDEQKRSSVFSGKNRGDTLSCRPGWHQPCNATDTDPALSPRTSRHDRGSRCKITAAVFSQKIHDEHFDTQQYAWCRVTSFVTIVRAFTMLPRFSKSYASRVHSPPGVHVGYVRTLSTNIWQMWRLLERREFDERRYFRA